MSNEQSMPPKRHVRTEIYKTICVSTTMHRLLKLASAKNGTSMLVECEDAITKHANKVLGKNFLTDENAA